MIERMERWHVPSDTARTRLDQYLTALVPDSSRSQIQSWIRLGLVRVNGSTVKTGYQLRPDDDITLERREVGTHPHPAPEEIPLVIIHDDEDLAVIDKPAGMVCHQGAGIRSGTLVNALLYHFGPMQTGNSERPGIVHRLDKLTSGIMVVAKNARTHRALAQQFKGRSVRKQYIALVYGHPKPASGTIDLPLGRDPRNRKKISVRAHRKRSALTHYETIKNYGMFSLLRVRIETGRTHQIRVHLAQQGHPLLGDDLYGGNRSRNLPTDLKGAASNLNRLFLHAHRLEFVHPGTGTRMAFTSPLPPVLQAFLELAAGT